MDRHKLSKTVLEMKFMKRSKEKKINPLINDVDNIKYIELFDKIPNPNSNFIVQESFVPCENLIMGRVSFNGMNPHIEEILRNEHQEKIKTIPRIVNEDKSLQHKKK